MNLLKENRIVLQKFDHKKTKVSKLLVIFFFVSQFCGLDFGVSIFVKKNWQKPLQYINFIFAFFYFVVLLCTIILYSIYDDAVIIIIEFTLHSLTLKCAKYTVCQLIEDCNTLYKLSGTKNSILVLTIIYPCIGFLVKGFAIYCTCSYEYNSICELNCFSILISLIAYFSPDLVAIAQIIIFYHILLCVRKLRQQLDSGVTLKNFELQYKAIVNLIDKIAPFYKKILLLQLTIEVPLISWTLWYLIYIIGQWRVVLTHIPFGVHAILKIALPAIVSEMINSEMDAIKLVFNEEILTEVDGKKKTNMVQLLRYFKARPLNFLTLRFIPNDLQLLLSLFTICSTYFIVLLQFTHIL